MGLRSPRDLSRELASERQTRQQLERELQQLREQMAQAPSSSTERSSAPVMVPRQLQVGRPRMASHRPGAQSIMSSASRGLDPPAQAPVKTYVHSLTDFAAGRSVRPPAQALGAPQVPVRPQPR